MHIILFFFLFLTSIFGCTQPMEDSGEEVFIPDRNGNVETPGDTGEPFPIDTGGDTGAPIDDGPMCDPAEPDDWINWCTEDADGDGIENWCDLFLASDLLADQFYLSERAFPVAYRDCDVFWVGEEGLLGGWTALPDSTRSVTVDGWFPFDPIALGLDPKFYRFTAVSACSASDATQSVDQFDNTDWVWADYGSVREGEEDSSFCWNWDDAYCHLNGDLSWSITVMVTDDLLITPN